MNAQDQALQKLRHLHDQGDYVAAVDVAATLPSELQSQPAIAVALARVRATQGYITAAIQALAAVDLDAATLGERLILTLEQAALHAFQGVAIRQVLSLADHAYQAATGLEIDPVDQAHADRVYARIQLIAAVYFEADQRQQALDSLWRTAHVLEQADHLEDALVAYLNRAQQLPEAEARQQALVALADWSASRGRANWQGEAKLKLAEEQLKAGDTSASITALLDEAAGLFEQTGHCHGGIDVRRVRAKLAIERALAGTQTLMDCLGAYRQLDFPRAEISVLMELSQYAHQGGDTALAAAYRDQSLELAQTIGLGSMRHNVWLSHIDLLMRSGDYGTALDLCQAGIASEPPAFLIGSYEQLQSSAYAFVNNYSAAIDSSRRALDRFESLGAQAAASNAAVSLANHLAALRTDAAWDEAEALLQAWAERDEQRGDVIEALKKREQQVQIAFMRFSFSPSQRGQTAVLDQADQTLQIADAALPALPPRDAALRQGNLLELRGQIAQARGDLDDAVHAWIRASAVYDTAGLAYESANCHYLTGVQHLNQANQDLQAYFGPSEAQLSQALTYYDQADMRSQAADTRFMLARLYANAAPRVPSETEQQLVSAALNHLAAAEMDYDTIRRAFAAGTALQIQQAKQQLIDKSHRIYALILDLLTRYTDDPALVWHWCQRAKARALVDVMGTSETPPTRLLTALQTRPSTLERVEQERELARRAAAAPSSEKLERQAELATLYQQMADDPNLEEYLALRTGAAIEHGDLDMLLAPETTGGRSCVAIDWMAADQRLWLLATRPGSEVQCLPLPVTMDDVTSFVDQHFDKAAIRFTLRDTPELLQSLTPLIAPIATLSQPEALLILSPTGPRHRLPLHALELDGEPLLARNPVVYCPSLSALRHCLLRGHRLPPQPQAALFGNPGGDLPASAAMVAALGQTLGVKPLLRDAVSKAAFVSNIADCDLVHFQGHALQYPDAPLDSYLQLADGRFTAQEVLRLPGLRAELITLAACETAANVIRPGDEPVGLVPAFLYAGAGAVLASLWPVEETSAAQTVQTFYQTLLSGRQILDKAQALRTAMLAVRAMPGSEAPYYWAAFTLHGNWR